MKWSKLCKECKYQSNLCHRMKCADIYNSKEVLSAVAEKLIEKGILK